jgi:hypothetical protein
MTIKCELTMLTFTKTKNTRLPDSVHNAGVTLQSRDIPHTLPSPIFYERAPSIRTVNLIFYYCQPLSLSNSSLQNVKYRKMDN